MNTSKYVRLRLSIKLMPLRREIVAKTKTSKNFKMRIRGLSSQRHFMRSYVIYDR